VYAVSGVSERDDATLPDPEQGLSREARSVDLGARYELRDVIGRGGMGEVRLARDLRIEREVAVKLMRATGDEVGVGRFLREARVQGVLDHPAVVPVHDLGTDRDGNPYFVMKRLAGTTLADVLASNDPAMRARWPRRQLLARLVDICLAIEFAHTRGVIHRDLKPANIMLGDFGEAYVLDWGLARILSASDPPPDIATVSSERIDAATGDSQETRAGDLLGTPGYMSPEQVRGDPVGAPTDVYALGCVLFEILVGKPALPRGLEALPAALAAPCHHPAQHAPDVAPEFDALCACATAADAAQRPTARQLADGIQAYLDGDRDLARRRDLADAHAHAAREAMRLPGDTARATAVREAGRALALDPENAQAQQVLGTLLITAPAEVPAGARRAAEGAREEMRRAVFGMVSYGFLTLSLITLSLLALPVRHGWAVALTGGLGLGTWGITRRLHASTVPGRSLWFVALVLMCAAMLLMCGILLGPLFILPMFVVGATGGLMSQPSDYSARLIIGVTTAPFLIVVVLELLGVLPQSIHFHDGGLLLKAWIVDLTPTVTAVVFGGAFLVQLTSTSLVGISTMRVLRAAQDRVHVQSWHLEQLLPKSDSAE